MNANTKIFWVIALFLLVVGGCSIRNGYNNAVTKDEAVTQAWGQVENVYQRRADLIPNLMEVVKGEANFEKSTLEAVTQARASATQMKIDPSNLTDENIAQFEKAQQSLGGALSRLLVASENYPTLQSNASFRNLMTQLEGSENRITTERGNFNQTAQTLNEYIRKFPRNMYMGIFGIKRKAYFQAAESAQTAPKIKF